MKRPARARSFGRAAAVGLVIVLTSSAYAPSGRRDATAQGATSASKQGLPLQAGPVVVRDVPYAERDGQILGLDVYRMEDAGPQPALVLVHGGSWRRRSKETWSEVAPLYAREGYVVFAVDYRLAPPGGRARFPDPVGDVQTAVDWVLRNSATYSVDPGRIAVVGSSAGGHLALLAAATAEAARPDAIVLFSAPVDLERLHRKDVLRGSIENFIGCPPETCPPQYRRASGRRALDESTPPVLAVFSRYELIPPDQPLRLAQRLEALGHPVELVELGGTRHGMAVAKPALEETLEFLEGRV